MELFMEFASEVILAVLGVAVTFLASKAGKILGTFFRQKLTDQTAREVASTCVRAVEQMYQEKSGAEKLEKALLMGEGMLARKGIKISAQELRYLLEAALSEAKGAFEKA